MGLLRFMFSGLVTVAFLALPLHVYAQVVDANSDQYTNNVSARDYADKRPAQTAARRRKVDPYTITGYDDGVFSLKPSLEIGAVATNNTDFTSTNRKADVGYVLKPSLSFATSWPVNQWTGSVSGNWISFAANSANDQFSGIAQTDFRLDIRRSLYVDLQPVATVSESMAGQSQVPSAAVASRRDWTFGSSAAVTRDFGSYQAQAKFGVLRSSYGDVPLANGTIINNSAANYIEPTLSFRGTLDQRHATLKPYVELTYDPRFHDVNGDQRNSQGGSVAVGVMFNDGPIWQGDISAIALGRVYADASLGLALNGGVVGNVTWSPTPLWSVVGSSTVALNESLVPGLAALPSWVIGINATYAVRENTFLHAGFSGSITSNGSGFDQTIGANAGADYMFTRHMGMTGTVQSTWINSSQSPSRDEQRVTVGMLLKP